MLTAIGPKALAFAGEHCDGVLLHPFLTPTGVARSAKIVRDAAARGLRLISYDRPGYGESSPQPGRTVVSAAMIHVAMGSLLLRRISH